MNVSEREDKINQTLHDYTKRRLAEKIVDAEVLLARTVEELDGYTTRGLRYDVETFLREGY